MINVLPFSLAVIISILVIGCDQQANTMSSQLAVKVNNGGVSVPQVNYELFLAKKRNPNIDTAKSAPAAIEQLINQELLAQKAIESGFEKNDVVQIAIDRTKKRILAQAYLEKAYSTMPAPTDEAIQAYFEGNPALFTQRRVYTLQQYAFGPGVDAAAIEAQVKSNKGVKAFDKWLEKEKVLGNKRMLNSPAEKLPMPLLTALQGISDGQGLVLNGASGPNVVWRVASNLQPVNLEVAKPSITRFLVKKAREERVRQELSNLRGVAKLEYVGSYKPESKVDMAQPLPVEETKEATETPEM